MALVLSATGASASSKWGTATAHVRVINDALQNARYDTKQPNAEFTLGQLNSEEPPPGAANWHGPYLTEVPTHPYSGGAYVYDKASDRYASQPSLEELSPELARAMRLFPVRVWSCYVVVLISFVVAILVRLIRRARRPGQRSTGFPIAAASLVAGAASVYASWATSAASVWASGPKGAGLVLAGTAVVSAILSLGFEPKARYVSVLGIILGCLAALGWAMVGY